MVVTSFLSAHLSGSQGTRSLIHSGKPAKRMTLCVRACVCGLRFENFLPQDLSHAQVLLPVMQTPPLLPAIPPTHVYNHTHSLVFTVEDDIKVIRLCLPT